MTNIQVQAPFIPGSWTDLLVYLALGAASFAGRHYLVTEVEHASQSTPPGAVALTRRALTAIGLAQFIKMALEIYPNPPLNQAISVGITIASVVFAVGARSTGRWVRAQREKESQEKRLALETQQHLADRIRQLEMFSQAASHDMREPLRMVNSYLKLLARDYRHDLDERGQEFLDFSVDGGARLEQLLSKLMDYFRMGRNVDKVSCDLAQLVEQVRVDLSLLLEESAATLQAEGLPTVSADPILLKQVLENLVTNAVRYSPPDRKPTVTLAVERVDSNWHITVQDNGLGIPKESLETIFHPFKRAHRLDDHRGTGLGLAICRSIMEGHGGDIKVQSQEGVGSTFTLILPVV